MTGTTRSLTASICGVVVSFGKVPFEEIDEEDSDLVAGFYCQGKIFNMGCFERA